MEIYLLDSSYRPIEKVEGYVSFIWTERYNSHGDFELRVPRGQINTGRFYIGYFIYLEDSNTLMRIERYYKELYSGRGDTVTISGRSIVSWLADRSLSPNASSGNYEDLGAASMVIARMVRRYCVEGYEFGVTSRDIIPGLSVPWPSLIGDEGQYSMQPGNMYNHL